MEAITFLYFAGLVIFVIVTMVAVYIADHR